MQIQFNLIGITLTIIISICMVSTDMSYEDNYDGTDACEDGFRTNDWQECTYSLSTYIWNTHTWYDNSPITVCNFQCTRKLKGRIDGFQWVWDAKFACGEQDLGISGEARGFKVRQKAMKQAIALAIEQAFIYGQFTPNDFKCD